MSVESDYNRINRPTLYMRLISRLVYPGTIELFIVCVQWIFFLFRGNHLRLIVSYFHSLTTHIVLNVTSSNFWLYWIEKKKKKIVHSISRTYKFLFPLPNFVRNGKWIMSPCRYSLCSSSSSEYTMHLSICPERKYILLSMN